MIFFRISFLFQLRCLSFARDDRIFLDIDYKIFCTETISTCSKKRFVANFSEFDKFEDNHSEQVGQNGLFVEVIFILSLDSF